MNAERVTPTELYERDKSRRLVSSGIVSKEFVVVEGPGRPGVADGEGRVEQRIVRRQIDEKFFVHDHSRGDLKEKNDVSTNFSLRLSSLSRNSLR